mgnify:CR=1 FL=1
MPQLSMPSPLGHLTLVEEGGHITGLRWQGLRGKAGRSSEATPLLRRAQRQLEAYFQGRRQSFDLPLAPAGTAFQKAVWQAMSKIPHGKTRSYGQLAKDLKSGPRAVGGACGRNPIPILIPCHRVLGAHGALGGYSARGGVATKRRLLALEAGT